MSREIPDAEVLGDQRPGHGTEQAGQHRDDDRRSVLSHVVNGQLELLAAGQLTPCRGQGISLGAVSTDPHTDIHQRVRTDTVGKPGKVTLRYSGQLYAIGVGRPHARTRVLLLVQDRDVRIINAATGELLRELILNTSKRYQGARHLAGRPR